MKKGDTFFHDFLISESIYKNFIELFSDKNPIHTDASFAQNKGFKSVVMHGNILNGFISFFVGEMLPIKNVIIQTQEIKYFHPVYLNERLQLNAEIQEVYESVNSIEFKFYFLNGASQKVAKGKILIGII